MEELKNEIKEELKKDFEGIKKDNDILTNCFEVFHNKFDEMKDGLKLDIIEEVKKLPNNEVFQNTELTKIKKDITDYVEKKVSARLESTQAGKQEIQQIIKDNNEMRHKVIQIEKNSQRKQQDGKNNTSEINIKEVQDEIETKMKKKLMETMKYEEDRKEREKNFIIFNMDESLLETGYEREKEDYERTQQLIYDGTKTEHFEIIKTIRLGKKQTSNSKPRPLLVKLSNSADKWRIIKNAKNLKSAYGKMKKCGIMPDLNEEDRKKEKLLFDQLKEKRNNGEIGWYIYKSKLIQRENVRQEPFHAA